MVKSTIKIQNLKEEDSEKQFKRLRIFNLVMGMFHLIQAIVMIFIVKPYSLPVTINYVSVNPVTRSFDPASEQLFSVYIGLLGALFLILSAFAHFILASSFFNKWYNDNLKKKINYARWYEYAFSSSLMIIIIALLCGMYDAASLIMIFTLNMVMNLCGLMMEKYNHESERVSWTPYVIGCIAGIAPWIALSMYFFKSISSVEGSIPTLVYWILATIFAFFNVFAVNMFLQYKKIGPWKDYLFGEKVYILLSLTAKSALAWQVFFGTTR